MTEVLLLLLALGLTLACAVFVVAEFSLTTVERGELERAVEAKERGAEGALRAVRRLTVQLSGAQFGITVTSLVIGMLAEPSLAAPAPWPSVRPTCPARRAGRCRAVRVAGKAFRGPGAVACRSPR